MIHVTQRVTMPVAALQVWQIVRDFGGITAWLPDVCGCQVSGQGVGAVRRIVYVDGFQAEERLESLNELRFSLRYTILTVTAFADACFFMSVLDLGEEQSEFVWSCYFTPQGLPVIEAKTLMANALARGCAGLQKCLEETMAQSQFSTLNINTLAYPEVVVGYPMSA